MSCASAGNCSAIGFYSINEYDRRTFVAGEKNGKWGKAQVIPGTKNLEIGGVGKIMSVSCSSAGNCAAFGTYATASNDTWSCVASEARGVWKTAVELPGVVIDAVSCGSLGNCAAGGYAGSDGYSSSRAITVDEVSGKWGKPQDLPGIPANALGQLVAVSCPSSGSCAAGGDYVKGDATQVFVTTDSKGKLHRRRNARAGIRGRPAQRHLGQGADHPGPRIDEPPCVREGRRTEVKPLAELLPPPRLAVWLRFPI